MRTDTINGVLVYCHEARRQYEDIIYEDTIDSGARWARTHDEMRNISYQN
jgi:hypothetical protein